MPRSPSSRHSRLRAVTALVVRFSCNATIISFLALLTSGCDEQILHDLSEQDANKVLSRLSTGKLGAKKVAQSDGRWAISVSRDAIVPALSYLDTHRILSPRSSLTSSPGKGSFVPSREEQWFRYERSVAVSIEDSLNAMSGVLEARVHLNLPETDPLFGTRKQDAGSGSVLLVVDGRYLAKDEEVSGLVSGAAGIPATRVTVLKSQAQMTTPPHQTAQHLLRDTEAISLGPQRKGRFSIEPRQVGVVSAALAACAVIGWMVFRLRRKRVTFSLPEDLEVEGDNV